VHSATFNSINKLCDKNIAMIDKWKMKEKFVMKNLEYRVVPQSSGFRPGNRV